MLEADAIEVSLRDQKGDVARLGWSALTAESVLNATPWRAVRHSHGHHHHPGWFWSAKAGRFVMYESRLEMMQLLELEFDHNVDDIREQPFQMAFTDAGRRRRHTPDFFVTCRQGADRLINVKPPNWERHEPTRRMFAELDGVCGERGWDYETWTGRSRERLLNLQWLAGYRRREVIPATAEELSTLLATVEHNPSIGAVERAATHAGVHHPRPALLHLLWVQAIHVDLELPLNPTSEVWT